MKKSLLCLVMALAMLLSVGAFAESEENTYGVDPNLYTAYGYELDLNVGGSLTEGMYEGRDLLVFVCTGEFGEPATEMAYEFNELTGANVQVEIYSGTELITKINLALNGEEPMDCFWYVTAYLDTWNSLGLLEDLKALSEEYGDPAYNWDGFMQGLLGRNTDAEGHIFGVPAQVCEFMAFYRNDYLTAANMTIPADGNDDEFIELLQHFTQRHNPDSPSEFGFITQYGSVAAMWVWQGRLAYYGGSQFDSEWNCALLDNDAAIKAMEFGARLLDCGPVDNYTQYGWTEINTAICEGHAFMIENWTSAEPYVTDNNQYENIGFMTSYGNSQVLSGWSWGINTHSTDKELAWKYIEFCTSADGEMTKLDEGCSGARSTTYERLMEAGIKPEYQAVIMQALGNGGTWGDICMPYLGNQGNTIFGEWTQRFLAGEVSAEEALENIVAECTEALEDVGVL